MRCSMPHTNSCRIHRYPRASVYASRSAPKARAPASRRASSTPSPANGAPGVDERAHADGAADGERQETRVESGTRVAHFAHDTHEARAHDDVLALAQRATEHLGARLHANAGVGEGDLRGALVREREAR